MRCALLLLLFLAGLAVVSASETHPFSVHDMLAMQRISDPQVSPDGRRIVFALRTTDLEANRGRTDLWLVGVDGEGLRRLTSDPAPDGNPRWSPDGRWIYFLSSRSERMQVWRIAVDGGEAEQLTDQPLDITSLAVSPDGKHLAVSMDVFVDCDSPQCSRDRLDEIAARKATGRVYERLFIRHWDAWKDGRRSHLFVVPVGGGEAVDVMRGMDADCPSKPFGGPEEYTFAPDGGSLVFTARDAGREEAWSTDFDLYAAPADGSKAPSGLTSDNPDGKTLAYLAMNRPGFESDRQRIVLRPWPDGAPRVLTEGWDRSPRSLAWSADGATLYTSADNLGQRSLFAVDTATGEATPIVEQGTVRSVAVAGDRLVYALDHLRSPAELYSVRPDGRDGRRVTRSSPSPAGTTRWCTPTRSSRSTSTPGARRPWPS
jgi:Tol biopolymer transport system component